MKINTLTLEKLKEMEPHTTIATGVAMDNEGGLFMANTGQKLRWVAIRGGYHDWAIYCHFAENDIEWIKKHGDKVNDKHNIKKCVKCDDGAFKMYRH